MIRVRRRDDVERPRIVFDPDRSDLGSGRRRIRCPRCGWEPDRQSRWSCACLYLWNTFDTGGRCPACGKNWEQTQCLRCKQWSPHRDWYVDEDDSD